MPIQLREETLDLHDGAEALTIFHISDIHVWFSKGILDQLKTIILENDPELLVFTGDYFDTPTGAYLFRDFLQEVARSYKTVFIRGNHDFVYGSRIADIFLDIPNCQCVENSVCNFISRKGFSYNITSWNHRQELKKHSTGKNIVLIHNPEKLKEKEMDGIDLILAGHLHGGQLILFKTAANTHFPGNLLYKYCTDRKQLHNTTLIISKGLGDTFPIRFNCAKEVVKITIN